MTITNGFLADYAQVLAQMRGPSPPDRAGAGTGAGTEVECRSALLTAVAELTPELRPVRTLLEACRDDPARFQEEVLGRRLWAKQVEVCQAIARSPITVVPAGRAVGKSFLLAGTVLWWLYTRPGSLVITTGPDHRQVVSVLWKEIRRALRPRGGLEGRDSRGLVLGHDHLTAGYTSPQRLVVKMGTDWGALGFAAQYEEGFSGQHAGELLVIVDEASGVAAPIWSAIHGLAAARLVAAGNPIRYDCHFRELHDLATSSLGPLSLVPGPLSLVPGPLSCDGESEDFLAALPGHGRRSAAAKVASETVDGLPSQNQGPGTKDKGQRTRSIVSVPISSLDSPDAKKDISPVGMASRTFLNQMREIHGEESPWWRSNILGIFPGQESVRFLPSAWLDACTSFVPCPLSSVCDGEIKDGFGASLKHTVDGLPSHTRDKGQGTRDDLYELWTDYPAGSAVMGVDIGGGVGADRSVVVVRNQKQILAVFASEWHGVLDEARHRLEPVAVELARKWGVAPDRLVYDKAGLGRSFGSYLAARGFDGAVGYFGAGKGGKLYVNRRTANAFALKRRLDPHRENHVPFYCGGIPEWPGLRQELAELRSPTMEIEEGQVKQVLEDKEALAARLHHSPDMLDALLMTFTYADQG